LEHYEDIADIKRAIVHTTGLTPDVCYFSFMSCQADALIVHHLVACELFQPVDN
jgi:clathrin heavy chain